MKTKKKSRVSKVVASKAKQVLDFAEERAKTAADWLELHFALYGVDGKATEIFPTESQRRAFSQTPQYLRILDLIERLPEPAKSEVSELVSSANGAISVRLPRSVHAALLVEAKAEGVSLNQLCLSKLVAQLGSMV